MSAAAVTVLLAATPGSAQTTMPSSGWPTTVAPSVPEPKPTSAPQISAPAATRRRPTARKKSRRPTPPARTNATSAVAAQSIPARSTLDELIKALETQSALLARLVTELEENRAMVRRHEQQLAAVATTAAAPGPSGRMPGSDRLVEALFRFDRWDANRRAEASTAIVTGRDSIGAVHWPLGAPTVRLQANLIQKTFFGAPPGRSVFLVNLQTAW